MSPRYSGGKIHGWIAKSTPERIVGSVRLYEVRRDLSAELYIPIARCVGMLIGMPTVIGLCTQGIDRTFPANDPDVDDDSLTYRTDEPCLWESSL